MIKIRIALCAISISAASLISGIALGQVSPPRELPVAKKWNVTPFVGTEFSTSGNSINSASESFAAAGTAFGRPYSASATFSTPARKYSDTFSKSLLLGANANYGLSGTDEVFVGLRMQNANAKQFDAINLTLTGTFAGRTFAGAETINGKFGSLHQNDLEIGYRHFFSSGGSVTPYLSGALGMSRTSDINLELLFRGSTLTTIPFYKAGWVPSAALGFGIHFQIAKSAVVGVETGIRYRGALKQDDKELEGGRSFENVNNSSSRTTMPLTVSLKIDF